MLVKNKLTRNPLFVKEGFETLQGLGFACRKIVDFRHVNEFNHCGPPGPVYCETDYVQVHTLNVMRLRLGIGRWFM